MANRFVWFGTEERSRWIRNFVPSDITFLDLKTGRQVQGPSLVALKRDPDAKKPQTADCCAAVGSAALTYQDDPDAFVYSPLRHGQVADYTAAVCMFSQLFRQLRPGRTLWKPIMYVHAQEHTTEVEERALVDAMLQIGARRVICYLEPLPDLLAHVRNGQRLQNACVLHIEPREERDGT